MASAPGAGRAHAQPLAGVAHAVQFYDDEAALGASVADWVVAGLALGLSVVVIAPDARLAAVTGRLVSEKIDPAGAVRDDRVVFLDARTTLAAIMADGGPDPARFREAVVPAIERAARRSAGPVRLYGEMVDLLWKDGNPAGAIRLEQLWNELAATHPFSLLCAYAMRNFASAADAERFREVCGLHGEVRPPPHWAQADDAGHQREIAILQQRAQALETELAHSRALEQELRQSGQELEAFLEDASEGIHWVGPDGIILWANRAELALLGYTAGEYIGHHIADFHADTNAIADMLGRLARNETLQNYETRLKCKDGSVRDVLVNSNVLWRDGQFVHTRCFTRDITDIRQAAAERERLLGAERAARAEAEAANRAKTDFLAVMSHELRTPLNAIAGYTELLELGVHGPLTAEQHESLERIQGSQRHLLALINDVLNYARLEAGTVRYDMTDVPLRETLASVEALVAPQARAKGLSLTVHEADGIAVRADADKLRQILVNLLSNAIKFTDRGGAITIDCEAPDEHALVRVRDTGIGIPADRLDSVFEPFVQVQMGLTRTVEGTGLGLAISRDLARALGGDLTAASVLGTGSCFTLSLNRAVA